MKNYEDWDWTKYTAVYMRQMAEVYRDKLFDILIDPTKISHNADGVIEFGDSNLHPNHAEIYHLVDKFQPKSVLEVGVGCGYLIKNISVILPEADIHGIDISEGQLGLCTWFPQLPERILNNLRLMDISQTTPDRTFDFVYTQAVLMHMTTARATQALHNMKKISNKYVFMVEAPNAHPNWEDIIKSVFSDWEFSKPRRFLQDGILVTKK